MSHGSHGRQPGRVVGYKVWIEIEEERADDSHQLIDLPFASTSYFAVADYEAEGEALAAAESFAQRLHESHGIDAG